MFAQRPPLRPLGPSLRPLRTFAALLFVSGCVLSAPTVVPASDGQPHIGESAAGNYLAGRHAEQVGQSLAAMQYYGIATTRGDLATADLYKRIYILALTEGRIDEALTSLEKVEKAGEKAPFANLLRAVHAIKINNFAPVEELLKDEKTGLVRLLAPPLIAWAKVGQNDHQGALQALAKMKEESALEALHDLHAALIEERAGNAKAAEDLFVSVLAKAGMSTRITELLGGHFERLGKFDKATELYSKFTNDGEGAAMLALSEARRKANKKRPLDVATAQDGAAEALFNIASVLQSQAGDSRVQVLAHLSLYLRPNMTAANVVAAAALEAKERYADANAIYATVPKDSPLSWNTRMRMADNLDRMGNTDDAVHMLRALARERTDREVPLIELGDVLRRHERFKEAAEAYTDAFKRIEKIDARHWTVFYARGIAYEQTDRWPLAEKDFLQALEFEPDQPLVLNYLGYSWIDQGLHLDRALKMIEKAVDLRPRDGYIVDSLGWGLYRLGQFDEAVKKLERAVMLRPADPVINDHLGDALWQVGRTREARFQWERAKTLEPDADLAEILNQKLKDGLKTAPAI
ncbi:tetratricopeptide repeat protein [Magnetovibrio sp.]|uniref:tetratricopeptide repeat protein n=1 Tax=Magnetovibrio sp. TaxID=2024836 RepID=UPI002F9280DB